MLTVGRFEVTLYGRFWVTPEESGRAPGSGHTVEDAITAVARSRLWVLSNAETYDGRTG